MAKAACNVTTLLEVHAVLGGTTVAPTSGQSRKHCLANAGTPRGYGGTTWCTHSTSPMPQVTSSIAQWWSKVRLHSPVTCPSELLAPSTARSIIRRVYSRSSVTLSAVAYPSPCSSLMLTSSQRLESSTSAGTPVFVTLDLARRLVPTPGPEWPCELQVLGSRTTDHSILRSIPDTLVFGGHRTLLPQCSGARAWMLTPFHRLPFAILILSNAFPSLQRHNTNAFPTPFQDRYSWHPQLQYPTNATPGQVQLAGSEAVWNAMQFGMQCRFLNNSTTIGCFFLSP